jgi:outer membrane protein TolC
MKKVLILLYFISISSLCFADEVLTLGECIDLAMKNNLDIRSAEKKLKEAKAQRIIARGSFLPSLSLSGSAIKLGKIPVISFGGTDIEIGGEYNYSYRLGVRQSIFTWGKIWNAYKISSYGLKAAESDYRRQKISVKFDVTKTFYSLIFLEKMSEQLEDTYSQMEKHLDVVNKRYKDGLASKLELLRTEVQVANFKTQLLEVKNNFELARNNFNVMLGIDQNQKVVIEGKYEPDYSVISEDEAVRKSLSNRPEIISFEEGIKIAKKSISLARAGNKPNLSLMYNLNASKPYNWEDVWGDDWNVGAYLDIPLFSGFSNLGRVKQAKARYEQSEIEYRKMKEYIALEVKGILLSLKKEKENIISQEHNIKQAEEALNMAEQRYKSGLITSIEYMETQIAFTEANTNHLQALSNYIIKKVELEKAMGVY